MRHMYACRYHSECTSMRVNICTWYSVVHAILAGWLTITAVTSPHFVCSNMLFRTAEWEFILHLLFTKYTYQFQPFSFGYIFWFVCFHMHKHQHIYTGWNARAATVHRAVTGHPIRCIQTKISTKPVQITFASALSLFSSPRTRSFEHGLAAIDLIYRTPAFLCDFRWGMCFQLSANSKMCVARLARKRNEKL